MPNEQLRITRAIDPDISVRRLPLPVQQLATCPPVSIPSISGLATTGNANCAIRPRTTGREIALAIPNSRQLARSFIEKYELLPVLFAEKWDSTKKTWTVTPDKVPTAALDGVQKFKNILTVSDDSLTGVISVAIRFSRRDIVASMANNFVALADDTQRQTTRSACVRSRRARKV